jgi:oxepin-CoA hydrolase/3-oxo-5,6-dehydrosuberyl-CoA semialdehyde dehydrogenase
MRIASGDVQDFEISTKPEYLEKVIETVYNYKPMPKEFKHPLMSKDSLEPLRHADLAAAKQQLLAAWDAFDAYFKVNPDVTTKNAVFGNLEKFEWDLLNIKHLNHHFEQFGIL